MDRVMMEGTSKFIATTQSIPSREASIFYNPVMRKNRDLTVLLLNALGRKQLHMLDLMAGSGVRSIRLLKELNPGILERIVVNDKEPGFTKRMQHTLVENEVDPARVLIREMDANKLLLESTGFDYIDIDPYGSPNQFLDNAIVRLSRDGLLGLTATDTAALCGARVNACKRKYWAVPLNNELHHELGLRIFIRKVQLLGAQNDKALLPIFSYFSDHYFRAFFHCEKGRQKVDVLLKKHAFFLYCSHCMRQKTSSSNRETCVCGKSMVFAGPLWTGALSDAGLVAKMQKLTHEKELLSFLDRMDGDCTDIVGFYDLHMMAKKRLITALPKMETLFDSKKLLRTHFSTTAVKTADYLQLQTVI